VRHRRPARQAGYDDLHYLHHGLHDAPGFFEVIGSLPYCRIAKGRMREPDIDSGGENFQHIPILWKNLTD
jgi:hypothetical protein